MTKGQTMIFKTYT